MKSIIRIQFECEKNHPWNWIRSEQLREDANLCPVCGNRAVRYANLTLPDYPILRIESAAFVDPKSGRIMGEDYFVAVLIAPDLSRQVRSRYPLPWDKAVSLIKEYRRMPFEKAAKLFVRNADGA